MFMRLEASASTRHHHGWRRAGKLLKIGGSRSLAIIHVFQCYIDLYIITRVRSAFSLIARCVLLKYTRTDDVN